MLLLLPFSLMDSSRLHTIVLMAVLGAILVLEDEDLEEEEEEAGEGEQAEEEPASAQTS